MVTQQSCIIPRGAERLERLGVGSGRKEWEEGGGGGGRGGGGKLLTRDKINLQK